MNDASENDREERFLRALFEATQGNAGAQVSMYAIGSALGLEKSDASRTAQALMAGELVEVRTLAGGIGITAKGLTRARALGAGGGPGQVGLSRGPAADADDCRLVARATDRLKVNAGQLGLAFEALAELIADLRTIDMQLSSPLPKVDVLRACLTSIRDNLKRHGQAEALAPVAALLGTDQGLT